MEVFSEGIADVFQVVFLTTYSSLESLSADFFDLQGVVDVLDFLGP